MKNIQYDKLHGVSRTDTRVVFKSNANRLIKNFDISRTDTRVVFKWEKRRIFVLMHRTLEPTQELYLNRRKQAVFQTGMARTDTRVVFKL